MQRADTMTAGRSGSILGRMFDAYVDGDLPLPTPVIHLLLTAGTDLTFRFARKYPELPPEWSGAQGALAEKSEALMRIHYDQPRELFEYFLGPTMKYTMALWERGARNLDEAQTAMMEDLCAKAGIQDGDNVLDIACGFGSLSTHILKRYPGCHVTAVNLSKTQCDYIAEKQFEAGHPMHTDRFRLIREDFARVHLDREYDRVFVIGLFEHIRNLRGALERLSEFLKPDGTLMLHYIAYNHVIRALADPSTDLFFGRYIFPGGRFWHFKELFRYQDHLAVRGSWFLNGKNYKRTVREWHRNFWRNIDAIRAIPSLDDRFIRTWDLYLRFCIAAFGAVGGRNVGNGQYCCTLRRR